tara:strand:+ start:420 stop:1592 length:1173 start_codon:yes stop_codon:yes gene_type:complete
MKICVVGTGYVGLSLAILISQKYEVVALDIDKKKVDLINKKQSPIQDKEIEEYLKNKKLNLNATLNNNQAYANAIYTIVATPTNYNEDTGKFDTSSVEQVIEEIISINPSTNIVIKSTVPLGFTDKIKAKLNIKNLFFSPEFLRETKALFDNLHPSRIVVGDVNEEAEKFANILAECAIDDAKDISILKMKSKEAEAVKLFSNTYLAMRISFFNELDSFSEIQNLSSNDIISGVSSDERIGNYYNNPSFGYGGYCLPKDTKQLLDNYNNIPNSIIKAVVSANTTRKDFIVNSILNKFPKTVGVYRLIMKEGSDNFRESAVLYILEKLIKRKIKVVLYEPLTENISIEGLEIENNLDKFFSMADLIIANRDSKELDQVRDKVYTRDIFQEN